MANILCTERSNITKFRPYARSGEYIKASDLIAKRFINEQRTLNYGIIQRLHKTTYETFAIAGLTRSGKTLVAKELVKFDIDVVPMDLFRMWYRDSVSHYDITPSPIDCRRTFFRTIIDYNPYNLCLEGSDIWFQIRNNHKISKTIESNFAEIVMGYDCPIFLLGISEEGIEKKAQQLYKSAASGNCRLKRDFDECRLIAAKIAKESQRMKKLSDRVERIFFVDAILDPENVTSSARQIALTIKSILDSNAQISLTRQWTQSLRRVMHRYSFESR